MLFLIYGPKPFLAFEPGSVVLLSELTIPCEPLPPVAVEVPDGLLEKCGDIL